MCSSCCLERILLAPNLFLVSLVTSKPVILHLRNIPLTDAIFIQVLSAIVLMVKYGDVGAELREPYRRYTTCSR